MFMVCIINHPDWFRSNYSSWTSIGWLKCAYMLYSLGDVVRCLYSGTFFRRIFYRCSMKAWVSISILVENWAWPRLEIWWPSVQSLLMYRVFINLVAIFCFIIISPNCNPNILYFAWEDQSEKVCCIAHKVA